jgi:fibronectin-binding autotransporter adhesin
MKPRLHLPVFFTCALISLKPVFAAEYTWSGSTGGTWNSTNTNWSGAPADPWNAANGPGNIARFNLASLNAVVSGLVYTNGINFATAGTLGGTGTINLVGTNPTITTTNAGTINALLAGSSGFIKAGTNTLTLRGANTGLSGIINLQAGRLSAGGATANVALGTEFGSSTVDVTSTAYIRFFQVANTSATAYTANLILRGNGNGTGALQNDGNATANHIHWNGTIELADNATINAQNSGQYTFNGNISQSGGSRTLTLSANGGTTTINAGLTMGAVSQSGNSALSFGSAATINVGSYTANAGTGALNFGTSTVSSLTSLTTSRTTNLGKADQLAATTAVTVNTSGTLNLGGFAQQAGALTLAGGTVSNGTVTATAYDLRSGTLSAVAAGSANFAKTTASTVTISSNNSSYTGDTVIDGGILTVTHSNALGTNGSVTVNAGSGNNLYLGASGIDISRPLTINGGGGIGIGALYYNQTTGTATYSGAISVTGVTQAGGHFGSAGTGGTLDLTGAITHTAALPADRIINIRSGSVQLSATGSTYSELRLSEGLLTLGVANAIPNSAVLRVGDNSNASNSSTFDLNGFDQELAGISRNNFGSGASSTVTNSSATAATLTLDTAVSSTYAGLVTGNLSLVKQGGADFTLGTGTHGFTGTTTVEDGRLAVNGNISTSLVTVKDGGTLGGTGTLGGATLVESGGTIAPGNSPGSLTIDDNLTLDLGSILSMEIDGILSGEFDRLVVNGDLTANATLMLVLGGLYTPASGHSFDLLDWTGTFAGSPDFNSLPALGGGLTWDTSTFTSDGVISIIPEPSSALLGGLGLLALLRRRKVASGTP